MCRDGDDRVNLMIKSDEICQGLCPVDSLGCSGDKPRQAPSLFMVAVGTGYSPTLTYLSQKAASVFVLSFLSSSLFFLYIAALQIANQSYYKS
jgi:hypothetical protein